MLVRPLGDSPIDVRDRALLLIGYAGAFRRSELVALDVEDIAEVDDGLHIPGPVQGRPGGRGRRRRHPLRLEPRDVPGPGLARVAARLGHHRRRGVPLHHRARDDRGAGGSPTAPSPTMVQRRRAPPELDPAMFAGHSLRAGFATQAFSHGVPELSVMQARAVEVRRRCGGTSARASCGVITRRRSSGCSPRV